MLDLPDGRDPTDLARAAGPEALRAVLTAGTRPLVDLVVDDRLARHADRLQWAEGRLAAARDLAPLVAGLPAPHVGRQVARVAAATGLKVALVTVEVLDAVSRAADSDRSPAALAAAVGVEVSREAPASDLTPPASPRQRWRSAASVTPPAADPSRPGDRRDRRPVVEARSPPSFSVRFDKSPLNAAQPAHHRPDLVHQAPVLLPHSPPDARLVRRQAWQDQPGS